MKKNIITIFIFLFVFFLASSIALANSCCETNSCEICKSSTLASSELASKSGFHWSWMMIFAGLFILFCVLIATFMTHKGGICGKMKEENFKPWKICNWKIWKR